jgi:hypothetical protein
MDSLKEIIAILKDEEEIIQIVPDDLFYRHLNHDPKVLLSQTERVVFNPVHFHIGDDFFVRYYNEETKELIAPCKKCAKLRNDRRCPECLNVFHKTMLKKKKKK